MRDYISRDAAIRAHCDGCVDDGYCGKLDGRYACDDVPQIMAIPAADVIQIDYIEHQIRICEAIEAPVCRMVLQQLIRNYRSSTEKR